MQCESSDDRVMRKEQRGTWEVLQVRLKCRLLAFLDVLLNASICCLAKPTAAVNWAQYQMSFTITPTSISPLQHLFILAETVISQTGRAQSGKD